MIIWVISSFERRRQWHPTPVLLPGKSHGWRSLVGCSPWGCEESDTTERLHFHFSLSCIGEGNGNPLQCSCLENPRDGGTWWPAVYGVAQSQTGLKRLSSSIHTCTHTHTHTENWGNLSNIGRLYQCWHFDCNIIILQDVTLWRNQTKYYFLQLHVNLQFWIKCPIKMSEKLKKEKEEKKVLDLRVLQCNKVPSSICFCQMSHPLAPNFFFINVFIYVPILFQLPPFCCCVLCASCQAFLGHVSCLISHTSYI